MDLHGNHTNNVWLTTIGNPCKQLTRAPFARPCILPSQTHTRIMATCADTYFFHIGSEQFWNYIC